jgi:hypothetical protein
LSFLNCRSPLGSANDFHHLAEYLQSGEGGCLFFVYYSIEKFFLSSKPHARYGEKAQALAGAATEAESVAPGGVCSISEPVSLRLSENGLAVVLATVEGARNHLNLLLTSKVLIGSRSFGTSAPRCAP